MFIVDYWISSIEGKVKEISQNKIQRVRKQKGRAKWHKGDSQKTGIPEK